MRGSVEGEEPEALRTWITGEQAGDVELSFDNLTNYAKRAMKQARFLDQTGQCVYCGRKINLDHHNKHHVEHFRPRKPYKELEVDYGNLFLSCGPEQQEGGVQQTCGNAKENWFSENCHVKPIPEEVCQNHFLFASNGRILGVGEGKSEADKMIEILNLNYPELIVERSNLIEELDGELSGGVPLSELIKDFFDVSPDGTRVSFANVAIQYLQKQSNFLTQP